MVRHPLLESYYFQLLAWLDDYQSRLKTRPGVPGLSFETARPASTAVAPGGMGVQEVQGFTGGEDTISNIRSLLERPEQLTREQILKRMREWDAVFARQVEAELQQLQSPVAQLGSISLDDVAGDIYRLTGQEVNYARLRDSYAGLLHRYAKVLAEASKASPQTRREQYQQATRLLGQLLQIEDKLQNFISEKLSDMPSELRVRALAGARSLLAIGRAIREGVGLRYKHYPDIPGKKYVAQFESAQKDRSIEPEAAHLAAQRYWSRFAQLPRGELESGARTVVWLSELAPLIARGVLTLARNDADGQWYLFPSRFVRVGEGQSARYELIHGNRAIGMVLPIRTAGDWAVQLFGRSSEVYKALADAYDTSQYPIAVVSVSSGFAGKEGLAGGAYDLPVIFREGLPHEKIEGYPDNLIRFSPNLLRAGVRGALPLLMDNLSVFSELPAAEGLHPKSQWAEAVGGLLGSFATGTLVARLTANVLPRLAPSFARWSATARGTAIGAVTGAATAGLYAVPDLWLARDTASSILRMAGALVGGAISGGVAGRAAGKTLEAAALGGTRALGRELPRAAARTIAGDVLGEAIDMASLLASVSPDLSEEELMNALLDTAPIILAMSAAGFLWDAPAQVRTAQIGNIVRDLFSEGYIRRLMQTQDVQQRLQDLIGAFIVARESALAGTGGATQLSPVAELYRAATAQPVQPAQPQALSPDAEAAARALRNLVEVMSPTLAQTLPEEPAQFLAALEDIARRYEKLTPPPLAPQWEEHLKRRAQPRDVDVQPSDQWPQQVIDAYRRAIENLQTYIASAPDYVRSLLSPFRGTAERQLAQLAHYVGSLPTGPAPLDTQTQRKQTTTTSPQTADPRSQLAASLSGVLSGAGGAGATTTQAQQQAQAQAPSGDLADKATNLVERIKETARKLREGEIKNITGVVTQGLQTALQEYQEADVGLILNDALADPKFDEIFLQISPEEVDLVKSMIGQAQQLAEKRGGKVVKGGKEVLDVLQQRVVGAHKRRLESLQKAAAPLMPSQVPVDNVPFVDLVVLGNRGNPKEAPSGWTPWGDLIQKEIKLLDQRLSTAKRGKQTAEASLEERREFLVGLLESAQSKTAIPEDWAQKLVEQYYVGGNYDREKYVESLAEEWGRKIYDDVRQKLGGVIAESDITRDRIRQYLRELLIAPSKEVAQLYRELAATKGESREEVRELIGSLLSKKDNFVDLLTKYVALRFMKELPTEQWGAVAEILSNTLKQTPAASAPEIAKVFEQASISSIVSAAALRAPGEISLTRKGPNDREDIIAMSWNEFVRGVGGIGGNILRGLDESFAKNLPPGVNEKYQQLSQGTFRQILAQRLTDEALTPSFAADKSILYELIRTYRPQFSDEGVKEIVKIALERLRKKIEGASLSLPPEPEEAALWTGAILEGSKLIGGSEPWDNPSERNKLLRAYFEAVGGDREKIFEIGKEDQVELPGLLKSYIESLREIRGSVDSVVKQYSEAVPTIRVSGNQGKRLKAYLDEQVVRAVVDDLAAKLPNDLRKFMFVSPEALKELGEVVSEWVLTAARNHRVAEEMQDVVRNVKEAIGALADVPTTAGLLYQWLTAPPADHPIRTQGVIAYLQKLADSPHWKSEEKRRELTYALRMLAENWSDQLYRRLVEVIQKWKPKDGYLELRKKLVGPTASPLQGNWGDYVVAELSNVIDVVSAGAGILQLKPVGSSIRNDILHAVVGAWSTAIGRLLRNNTEMFLNDSHARDRLRALLELATGREPGDGEISAIQHTLQKYFRVAQRLIKGGYLDEKTLAQLEGELYGSLLLPLPDQEFKLVRAIANLVNQVARRIVAGRLAAQEEEGLYADFDSYHERHSDKIVEETLLRLLPGENEAQEAAEWYSEITGVDYDQSSVAEAQASFLAGLIDSHPGLRDTDWGEASREVLELAEQKKEAAHHIPKDVRNVWLLIHNALALPHLVASLIQKADPREPLEIPSLAGLLGATYGAVREVHIPALFNRYAQIISMIGGTQYAGLSAQALENIYRAAEAGDKDAQYIKELIEQFLRHRTAPLGANVGAPTQKELTIRQRLEKDLKELLSSKPLESQTGLKEPKTVSTIYREHSAELSHRTAKVQGLEPETFVKRAIVSGPSMAEYLPKLLERFRNASILAKDHRKKIAGVRNKPQKELKALSDFLLNDAANLHIAAQLLRELAKMPKESLNPNRFLGREKMDAVWREWVNLIGSLVGNYPPTAENLESLADQWERIADNLRYESLALLLMHNGHFVVSPETLEADILKRLREKPLSAAEYMLMTTGSDGKVAIPLRWMTKGLAHGYEIYEFRLPVSAFEKVEITEGDGPYARVIRGYRLKETPEKLIGVGELYRRTPVFDEGRGYAVWRRVPMDDPVRRLREKAYGGKYSFRLEVPGIIAMDDPRLALYHRGAEVELAMLGAWESIANRLLAGPMPQQQESIEQRRVLIVGDKLNKQARADGFAMVDHWGRDQGAIRVQYAPSAIGTDGFDVLIRRLVEAARRDPQPSVEVLAQEAVNYLAGSPDKGKEELKELRQRIASKQHPIVFEPFGKDVHSLLLGDYKVGTKLSVQVVQKVPGHRKSRVPQEVPIDVSAAWMLTFGGNAEGVLSASGIVGNLRVELGLSSETQEGRGASLAIDSWRLGVPSERQIQWKLGDKEIRLIPAAHIQGRDLQPVIENMLRLATQRVLAEAEVVNKTPGAIIDDIASYINREGVDKIEKALSETKFVPLYTPRYNEQLKEWTTVVGYILSEQVVRGVSGKETQTVLTLIERRMPWGKDPSGVVSTDYVGDSVPRVLEELASAQEEQLLHSDVIRTSPDAWLHVNFPTEPYVPVVALYKSRPDAPTEVRVLAKVGNEFIAVPIEQWREARRQVIADLLAQRGSLKYALPTPESPEESESEGVVQSYELSVKEALEAIPERVARAAASRLYRQIFSSRENLAVVDRKTLELLRPQAIPVTEPERYYPVGSREGGSNLAVRLWTMVYAHTGDAVMYTRWARYIVPLIGHGVLELTKNPFSPTFRALNSLLLALGIPPITTGEQGVMPAYIEGEYANLVVDRDASGKPRYRIILNDRFWNELIRPDNWGAFDLINRILESAKNSQDKVEGEAGEGEVNMSEIAKRALDAMRAYSAYPAEDDPRAWAYRLYFSGVAERFRRRLQATVDTASALRENLDALLSDIAEFNRRVAAGQIPGDVRIDDYTRSNLGVFKERLKTLLLGLRGLGWTIVPDDAKRIADVAFRTRDDGFTISVEPSINYLLLRIGGRLEEYVNSKLIALLRESIASQPQYSQSQAAQEGALPEDVEEILADEGDRTERLRELANMNILDWAYGLFKTPLELFVTLGDAYLAAITPNDVGQYIKRNIQDATHRLLRGGLAELDKARIAQMQEELEEAVQEVGSAAEITHKGRNKAVEEYRRKLSEISSTINRVADQLPQWLNSLENREDFEKLTTVTINQGGAVAAQTAQPQTVLVSLQGPTMLSAVAPFDSRWGKIAIDRREHWASEDNIKKRADEVALLGYDLLAKKLAIEGGSGIWLAEILSKVAPGYRIQDHASIVEALVFDVEGLSRLLSEMLQKIAKSRLSTIVGLTQTESIVKALSERIKESESSRAGKKLGVFDWLSDLSGLQKAVSEVLPLYAYTVSREYLVEGLRQYLNFTPASEETVLRAVLNAALNLVPQWRDYGAPIERLLNPGNELRSLQHAAQLFTILGLYLRMAAQQPTLSFIKSLGVPIPIYEDILESANDAVQSVRSIFREIHWLIENKIATIEYKPLYEMGHAEVVKYVREHLENILNDVFHKFWAVDAGQKQKQDLQQQGGLVQWLEVSRQNVYDKLLNNTQALRNLAESLLESFFQHPAYLLGLDSVSLEKFMMNRYLPAQTKAGRVTTDPPTILRGLQNLYWTYKPNTTEPIANTLLVFTSRQGHLVRIPQYKVVQTHAASSLGDRESTAYNILFALKTRNLQESPQLKAKVEQYEQELKQLQQSSTNANQRNQRLEQIVNELEDLWLQTLGPEDIAPLVTALDSLPGVKDVNDYLKNLKTAYQQETQAGKRRLGASARLYEDLLEFVDRVRQYTKDKVVPVIIVRPANPQQEDSIAIVQLWGIRVRPKGEPEKYTLEFVAPQALVIEGKPEEAGKTTRRWTTHSLLPEIAYSQRMQDVLVSGALAAQEFYETNRLMPGLYVYLGTHKTPSGLEDVIYPIAFWSLGDETYGTGRAGRVPAAGSLRQHQIIAGALQMWQKDNMGEGIPSRFLLSAATLVDLPPEYAYEIVDHASKGVPYGELPDTLISLIREGDYNALLAAFGKMGRAVRAKINPSSLLTAYQILVGLIGSSMTSTYKKMSRRVLSIAAPIVTALGMDYLLDDEDDELDPVVAALGLVGFAHGQKMRLSALNPRALYQSVKKHLKSLLKPENRNMPFFLAIQDPSIIGKTSGYQLANQLKGRVNWQLAQSIEALLPNDLKEKAFDIAENLAAATLAGVPNPSQWGGKLLALIDRPSQQESLATSLVSEQVHTATVPIIEHMHFVHEVHKSMSDTDKKITSLFLMYVDYVTSDPQLASRRLDKSGKIVLEEVFKDFLRTRMQDDNKIKSAAKDVYQKLESYFEVDNNGNMNLTHRGLEALRAIREYYTNVYFPTFYIAQVVRFADIVGADPEVLEAGVRRELMNLRQLVQDGGIHYTPDSIIAYLLQPQSISESDVYRSIAIHILRAHDRMLIHRYTWYNPEGFYGYRLIPLELYMNQQGVLTEDTPHARIWARDYNEAWQQIKQVADAYELTPIASTKSAQTLQRIAKGEINVRETEFPTPDVTPGQLVLLKDRQGRLYVAQPVKRKPPRGGAIQRNTIERVAEMVAQRASELYKTLYHDVTQDLVKTLYRFADIFAKEASAVESLADDPETMVLWTELSTIMYGAAAKAEELQAKYQNASALLDSPEAAKNPYFAFVRAMRELGMMSPEEQMSSPLVRRLLLAVLLRLPRPGEAAYAVRRSNALGYAGSFHPAAPTRDFQAEGYKLALSYTEDGLKNLLERAQANARRAAVKSSIKALRLFYSTVFQGVPGEVNEYLDQLEEAYLFKSRVHPIILRIQGFIGKLFSRFVFFLAARSYLKNVLVDLPVQTIALLPQLASQGERITPRGLGLSLARILLPPKKRGTQDPQLINTWQDLAEELASRVIALDSRVLANRIRVFLEYANESSLFGKIFDRFSVDILRRADEASRRSIATFHAYLVVSKLDAELAGTESSPTVLVGREFDPYIVKLSLGMPILRASSIKTSDIDIETTNRYASAGILLARNLSPEQEKAVIESLEAYLYPRYGIAYNWDKQKWSIPYQKFLEIVGDEVGRRVEATLGSFGPGDYSKLERAVMDIPGGSLALMLLRAGLPIIAGSLRAMAGSLAAAQLKWGNAATRLLNKYTASVFGGFLAATIFAGIRGLPVAAYLLLMWELLRDIIEEERVLPIVERAKKTAQTIWQSLYNIGVSVKTADALTEIIYSGLLSWLTQRDLSRDNSISGIGDIFIVRVIEALTKALAKGDIWELLRLSIGINTLWELMGGSSRAGRERIAPDDRSLLERLREARYRRPLTRYMLGVGKPAVFNEDQRAYFLDWAINRLGLDSWNALQLRRELQQLDHEKIASLYLRYFNYRYGDGIVAKLEKRLDEALERLKDNDKLMELVRRYLEHTYPTSWRLIDQATNAPALVRQILTPQWDTIALKLAVESEIPRWGEIAKRLQRRITPDGREMAEILRETAQVYDGVYGTNYTERLHKYMQQMLKQNRLTAYSVLATLAKDKEIPEELVLRFILAAELYSMAEKTLPPRPETRTVRPGLQSGGIRAGLQPIRPPRGLSEEQRGLIQESVEASQAEDKLKE
jgi:hypothetical protein